MSIRYGGPVSRSVMNLAANVRRLRVARGWTQRELGEKIDGVDGSWPQERVSELERGCFDRVLSVVDGIAGALGVHPSELIAEAPPAAKRWRPAERVRIGRGDVRADVVAAAGGGGGMAGGK